MNRLTIALLCVVTLSLAGGCAVRELGSSLKYAIQGDGYLDNKEYQEGLKVFAEAVRNDPANPQFLYYYGRFLLATLKAREAVPHLEKAAAGESGKSDYHFWLGVAYGETGSRDKERMSYQRALQLNAKNVQALTYLGNSFLLAGEYQESQRLFDQALELWPENPQALYNRAILCNKLKRDPEEKLAWRLYLDAHPAGTFARLAADRLNILGDYSYRNHTLGIRSLTLSDMRFAPFRGELLRSSCPSLDLVGATAANIGRGTLHIVVYQQNNRELAKQRALAIKGYLEQKFPELPAQNHLAVSWFDVPEERTVGEKKLTQAESVLFFLSFPQVERKEMPPNTPPPTAPPTAPKKSAKKSDLFR